MRINNVGLNLGQKNINPFKTSRNSTTNPFQNVSFEGNTLPFADVFEGYDSGKDVSFEGKQSKMKLIASSVAGSMTKMRSVFEPIVNFANRIGERISSAWDFTWNKSLFVLPGEEACKRVMNTDIIDIGKGIAHSASDLGKVLDKDVVEVGKEISGKISSKMGILGNGLSEKWSSVINSMKISHSPKISKETPVSDLRAMLAEELAINAERVAA